MVVGMVVVLMMNGGVKNYVGGSGDAMVLIWGKGMAAVMVV